MVAPAPGSGKRSPAILVGIAIAVFVSAIAGLAAYVLWPRGDRLGVIDLRSAEPSLTVSLAAGDTLNFRLDVTVGTASGYPNSSSSRTNTVHAQLSKSSLSLVLGQGVVPIAMSKCGAYDGKATTVSNTEGEVASSGLPLQCSLTATQTGRHVVSARVDWVPADVRKATLEVRRVHAGK